MSSTYIQLLTLIPLLGYLISLALPAKKENLISAIAFTTVGAHLFYFWGFVAYWLLNGHPVLNIKDIELYKSADYNFFIDFYFDYISAVYLFVGSLLTFLVAVYSRYYLQIGR